MYNTNVSTVHYKCITFAVLTVHYLQHVSTTYGGKGIWGDLNTLRGHQPLWASWSLMMSNTEFLVSIYLQQSVHEHCIDYGVSLGLREKPIEEHMSYCTITYINEIYIYQKNVWHKCLGVDLRLGQVSSNFENVQNLAVLQGFITTSLFPFYKNL